MELVVDQAVCQGHALCEGIASDLFEVSDVDGKSRVLVDMVAADRLAAARTAADACPERAIRLVE